MDDLLWYYMKLLLLCFSSIIKPDFKRFWCSVSEGTGTYQNGQALSVVTLLWIWGFLYSKLIQLWGKVPGTHSTLSDYLTGNKHLIMCLSRTKSFNIWSTSNCMEVWAGHVRARFCTSRFPLRAFKSLKGELNPSVEYYNFFFLKGLSELVSALSYSPFFCWFFFLVWVSSKVFRHLHMWIQQFPSEKNILSSHLICLESGSLLELMWSSAVLLR